jgi:uncharacterized membrane protein YeiB
MKTVGGGGMKPIKGRERVISLDVLRGFAIMGILVVNVEIFRGPQYLLTFAGTDGGSDAGSPTAVRPDLSLRTPGRRSSEPSAS